MNYMSGEINLDGLTAKVPDERMEHLYECLNSLDDTTRKVVKLSYLGNYTTKEIAKILGLKNKQIKLILEQGIVALKEMANAD